MKTKSHINPQPVTPDYRNTSYGESYKYNQSGLQTPNHKVVGSSVISGIDSDKKGSGNGKIMVSPKKYIQNYIGRISLPVWRTFKCSCKRTNKNCKVSVVKKLPTTPLVQDQLKDTIDL